MADDSLEKISKSFDTTYQETNNATSGSNDLTPLENVENQLSEIQEKKNALQKTPIDSFEDKDYLQEQLKQLSENSQKVLTTLEKDIKIGSSPRAYEVYAQLLNGLVNVLKELRELNRTAANLKMFENPSGGSVNTKVNIEINGRELLDMINNAKSDNQMNAIDTDFKIEEENIPSSKFDKKK